MDAKYNLSKLFSQAFGIKSPIFLTEPFEKKQPKIFDFSGISILEDYQNAEMTSWMGTPIIGLLTFKGGVYQEYEATGVLKDVRLIEFTLPPATLFSFRRAKNITKTNLLGSNGTVKEIFGFDDWVIDVKGLAVDTPEHNARWYLENLRDWEKLACAINVSGKLFNRKGINAIVMDDYREESIQGSPGIIPFSMTFTSDEAIELILPDVTQNQ